MGYRDYDWMTTQELINKMMAKLEHLNQPKSANVGEEQYEIEVIPLEAPVPAPSVPVPSPVEAPTPSPAKEPVPA